MKTDYGRVTTRFGPETRFEVQPVPAAPFRVRQEAGLELLKTRLLTERRARTSQPALNVPLQRAANEAAALAWATAYPLLVFPVLFEEMALAAVRHARRQEGVRERSRELLAA